MAHVKKVETFNEAQRRLLGYLGWSHGQPLPDMVKGLLSWVNGTKGTYEKDGKTFCKLIPGCSIFALHPATIANFIMFYCDSKVKKDDLQTVRMEFGTPQVLKG